MLNEQVISLPLAIVIVRGDDAYTSQRDEENVENLIANAANIWQQADIHLEVVKQSELVLSQAEFELFIRSARIFIQHSKVYWVKVISG